LVRVHVGNEHDVLLDQLGEIGEGAETIQEVGAHRDDELRRTLGGLNETDEFLDEELAQLFTGPGEKFLELIDEQQPLVTVALKRATGLCQRAFRGIDEIAGFSLSKIPLQAAAQRLERINVRDERERSKGPVEQARERGDEAGAHDRRFAAAGWAKDNE